MEDLFEKILAKEMEECCIDCVEPLEWLAYGPWSYREFFSTFASRLHFILNDKICFFYKQELPSVVITKALGDYTNLVGDFTDPRSYSYRCIKELHG